MDAGSSIRSTTDLAKEQAMDTLKFDAMVAAAGRRQVVIGLIAGAAALLGRGSPSLAKKRRKRKNRKRCKKVQAVCTSARKCCPKKTGRTCDSNAKLSDNCNLESTVCCLPLGAEGCRENCDCCDEDTDCLEGGVCGRRAPA